MKKIAPPTIGSVLIFVIYIMHQRFHFDANLLSIDCHRKAEAMYNTVLGRPVFFVLILATFVTAYSFRKEVKRRIFDYVLISIVFFHFLFIMVNIAIALFS